jgi:hypothetical protein
MNLPEFKAWFEGFTENLDGLPTAPQWKRINEKIKKIEDAPPVTRYVFDDYHHPWRRWYSGEIYQALSASSGQRLSSISNSQAKARATQQIEEVFDSGTAFRELGRAEARSIKKS